MGDVFVVGAGGYIGEGVAVAFRRHGYRVYGLVRDAKKAKKLAKNEIIPIVADQLDSSKYLEILKKCNIVIDAVGMSENSEKFLQIVKDAFKDQPERRLPNFKPLYIFTSGIMTYGTTSINPVVESTIPKPTYLPMQERKAFEEKVIGTQEFDSVVIRPGWVYGGSGGPHGDLFFGIKANEDLVLVGSRDKRWSWVHIDDLGLGYVLIANKGSSVAGHIYNLAALDNPRYEDVRVSAAKATGWNGKIRDEEIPKDGGHLFTIEPTVIINPQKAMDQLGWKPNHVGLLAEIETYFQSWKAHKE